MKTEFKKKTFSKWKGKTVFWFKINDVHLWPLMHVKDVAELIKTERNRLVGK